MLRHPFPTLFLSFVLLPALAAAQGSSSSTATAPPGRETPTRQAAEDPDATSTPTHTGPVRPRQRQADANGAAVTLETDEALFDLAAGLNVCGYDADLRDSAPVRAEVRAEIAAEVRNSALARQDQQALCAYMDTHRLSDRARDLAQYISLALYVTPPPGLEPAADQTDMPPDALQVINMLPQLRAFAESASLHGVWLHRRPEYQAILDAVHDSVTQMILSTNIYLKTAASGYDGRRLQILVEPLLSPAAPNARIYANDYTIVTSPNAAGAIRLDQIRHMYLHFELEKLVYARAQSMTRLVPLLKPVADAPLDFVYKSDVVALVTECMIKAIEARTMDVGFAPPAKPHDARDRQAEQRYTEELNAYERAAEVVRRKQVTLDMREGWGMTDYFYNQMALFEHSPESLGESIGQMVYGMDVDRVRKQEESIAFLPVGSGELVRRSRPAPTGMALAEKKMLEGDLAGAEQLADKALADPAADHADAMYVKARVSLFQEEPEQSFAQFEQVLKLSKSPHTTAWAHIYLGRLYDIQLKTDRGKAIAEYKAALAVPGIQPDATAAAESGLHKAFAVPRVEHREEEPLDPSGKAEKEAYKPGEAPK